MIAPKAQRPSKREEQLAYELVVFRDDGTCQKCLRGGVPQVDHRKNRSQGGKTTAANLQLLCAEHHLWKTDHPEAANREGWGCPGWADPDKWPARRWVARGAVHRLAWVLLNDDGDWDEISDVEASRRMDGGRGWPSTSRSSSRI